MNWLPERGEWTEPSIYQETSEIHHNYSVATAAHFEHPELGTVFKSRWTKMEPGGFIVPHIDASPYFERWQIPVEPAGYWWADGIITRPDMEPFPAEHWKPHAVWNPTNRPRIHLVIDLTKKPAGVTEPHPLVFCGLFPEIGELVTSVS